jgi:hypothetical protein
LGEREEAYAYYLEESEFKVALVGTSVPMSLDLAQKRMEQFNLPVPEVDAVFLTHCHGEELMPSAFHFATPVEFAGTKVINSGDTLITEELKRNSQDADPVVMDVMKYALVETMENAFRALGNERDATIFYDIREYHRTQRTSESSRLSTMSRAWP